MKKSGRNFSEQGRKNRMKGRVFEAKVRMDLEKMGWIVSKWGNTVDYEREGNIGKLVPAKRKYNPFLKAMVIGTGFPDFICFKKAGENYDIIGVEVKASGYLDRIEKGMCHWLLENGIFSRILVSRRGKKRGEILYVDFKEKYNKV